MSTPIAFHIMFALLDRRVIFKTPAERAAAYRRLARIGAQFGVLLFHLGSDHIHVVATCTPAELPRFAHAIECSWKQLIGGGVGFAHYHVKPVTDQGHLEALVRYVLRQDVRHAHQLDPFHLGTNAPDLCGGRVGAPHFLSTFRQFLPSIGRRDIERIVLDDVVRSVQGFGAAPGGRTGVDLERVLRAAAAASVGRAELTGSSHLVSRARGAVVRLCRSSALGETVDPARLVGCHRNYIPTLLEREGRADVDRAVRWQVAFRLQWLEANANR